MEVIIIRKSVVVSFVFLVIILLVPTPILAHTGLQSSSPEADSIVEQGFNEIVLEFNTEVEPLSSFKLKAQNGSELQIDTLDIDGSRIVGTIDDEIPNGIYTVEWKIVGSDGHPIEGDFKFTVNVQGVEPTPSPEQEPVDSASPIPTVTVDQGASPQEDVPVEERGKEQGGQNTGIWIVVGIVIIAATVLLFGMRRKK